jgi:DNA-binding Xre family transcriptional regulator
MYTVFPNSADVHGKSYRIAVLSNYRTMEKSKKTDEQVIGGSMLRNFWQTFYGKMKNIRLSLVSAMVKASLLLRCGDVETNPGPVGKISC